MKKIIEIDASCSINCCAYMAPKQTSLEASMMFVFSFNNTNTPIIYALKLEDIGYITRWPAQRSCRAGAGIFKQQRYKTNS